MFHHAVLLWAVRRDELPLQAVTLYQSGPVATGEDHARYRAQMDQRADQAYWTPASAPAPPDMITAKITAKAPHSAPPEIMETQ